MIYSENLKTRFADQKHLDFYTEQCAKHKPDCYLQALIYTLGMCPDTRRNFDGIYDAKERRLKLDSIFAAWQTSGSMKVTRLAFNLYTDGTPTAFKGDVPDISECRRYSVSDIFCTSYAPLFAEAIRIRYPEYHNIVRRF